MTVVGRARRTPENSGITKSKSRRRAAVGSARSHCGRRAAPRSGATEQLGPLTFSGVCAKTACCRANWQTDSAAAIYFQPRVFFQPTLSRVLLGPIQPCQEATGLGVHQNSWNRLTSTTCYMPRL